MSEPFVLVGMLDSPFVRRVAIALELYRLPFTNLPLRTVGDAAAFAAYSPLKRAPTLVLPGGEALVDSHLILAHLDELAAAGDRLLPEEPAARLACRQVMGVACGLADKAVSGVYENIFHPAEHRNRFLLERIRGQLHDALGWLDARAPADGFLGGARLTHGDLAVGCAIAFARDAHPGLLALDRAPGVVAWCARLDRVPEFARTYLPLELPVG